MKFLALLKLLAFLLFILTTPALAEKADRDKRLEGEVRSSIADRLRERGVDPSKASEPPGDDDDK